LHAPTSWRLRSLLFVPGDRDDLVPKAVAAGPDAVILDLEDALAPERRDVGRRTVAAALDVIEGPRRLVRVSEELAADLAAVAGPRLDGVVLPKVDGPDDVRHADHALGAAERAAGLPEKSIALLPLVESCRGLSVVTETALASDRVAAMIFSSGEEGDFMADLGGRWTPDGAALHYPRSRFVCDVRAAGEYPVIDGVCMQLERPDALTSESEIARTLGFDGKLVISPRQLPTVHAVFTPSPEEVAQARGMLEAFAAARAEGRAVLRYEGRMVDPANARVARRVLARAGAL
jgi:citrate lyase subunit beta/citryl-CoA lyase